MIKGKFVATIEIDIAVDENTPNLLPFEKIEGAVQNDMEVAVKDMLCEEFGDIATVKVTKTFTDLYRTEISMRLIDANEVVENIVTERDKIPYELVSEKPFKHGNSMRGGIRKALRCIEQAPTVDAVPVVRCRECKHRSKDGCPIIDTNIWMDDDDFCSHGEREEGAD